MNIINAIYNLVKNPVVEIVAYNQGRNRANDAGTALEEYVKDLFADTFDMNEMDRNRRRAEVFSYLGNNNNPPDAMLRGGDAVEIKKIENNSASLALNSSYPKQILRRDSPMISAACREAEAWTRKDMIYAVGVVKDNDLRQLSMIYGMDYCACEECYSRIKNTVKAGVEAISGVDFTETKELGRINRIDPLGITYMRVRGMWGIANPWSVFHNIYTADEKKRFDFMSIINDAKWATFDNTELLTSLDVDGFAISNVEIKNPDNPANLVPAKLITYRMA